MARTISREVASIGIRLVDEAYMSWCTAQTQCQNALRAWFDAGPRHRAEANCAYRAALDREQAAAATSNGCRSWACCVTSHDAGAGRRRGLAGVDLPGAAAAGGEPRPGGRGSARRCRPGMPACSDRTVWMVNSTAVGGGVAELLRALLPYWLGAGLDVRWAVIQARPAFFTAHETGSQPASRASRGWGRARGAGAPRL